MPSRPPSRATSDVRTRISEATPTVGHFLNRLLYRSSYMLSFGVVYPVMLVVQVVPKNNAIVHGLVNGAAAARNQLASRKVGGHTEKLLEEPASEPPVVENGSALDGKVPEPTNHRPRASRRSGSSHTTPKRSNRKS